MRKITKTVAPHYVAGKGSAKGTRENVSAGNKEKTFSVGKTGLNISVGPRRAVPLLGNHHN